VAEKQIDRTITRWRKLSGEKTQWHDHWDDLARVMLPRRLGFSQTTVTGERRTEDIFDGSPMRAARGLSNAIAGMLRPEGTKLVSMRVDDDAIDQMEEAQVWLENAEDKQQKAFNNPDARYRQATGEIDQDLVVFGTAVLFEGESRQNNSLLFQSLHLKDVTVVFSEEGPPNGLFQKKSMPLRWAMSRFGENNLSEQTRNMLREDKLSLDKKMDFLHVVLPRKDGREDALFSRDFPFTDQWIEIDTKHEVLNGGFHEFPFIIPRWDTSSGEDYGRSPGMIALPDADTLQAMGETILIAGQRSADPPLAAPNDGSFDALNTFPGGLSYYDVETAAAVRGNPFFALDSGMSLPITRDMQSDAREQVFAAFFRNIMNLPVEGPEMTATEVIQRKEEFIREIGPVFGRLESDYTAPMVERGFAILLRAGQFHPIPEILQGQNIRFEYESPVGRIRRQIEASAARMWAREQMEFAQLQPEAMDIVNGDEIGRFTADAIGLPRKLVNSTEKVEAIRAARQQAIEAQAQAEAIGATAEVLKTGAEAANAAGLVQEESNAS
jgi:hypothetical protein